MARYSSQAAVRKISEWIEDEDVTNDSDMSEGSDAVSSDEEDVLGIDSLVLTDEYYYFQNNFEYYNIDYYIDFQLWLYNGIV